MTTFTAIDLSGLPAPDVISTVNFETVLADMIARYSVLVPELAEAIQYESDPVRKLLEIAAYEKTLIGARVNNASKAVMLAFAQGPDLDHLAALIPLERHSGETDASFRARVQLAPEAFSVAGPRGGYEFHARKADPTVMDVYIDTYDPEREETGDIQPGDVHVYVLADPRGNLPAAIASKVLAAVNHDDVRPLTDHVSVKAPALIPYDIRAEIIVSAGADTETVRLAAEATARGYADAHLKFGGYVTRSGIMAALHVGGVLNVTLADPAGDVQAAAHAVTICTSINVSVTDIEGGA